MLISYFDKHTNAKVLVDLPAAADVIEVRIPPQDGQPELRVNVNTDAMIVDTADGKRVSMHEYIELLADADMDLTGE